MPVTDYIETTDVLMNRMVYWLFKPTSAIEGAATQAHTGAITEIKADGFATAPAATGYLILQNSAGETEAVAYTERAADEGVYTFTVDATLTFTYAENDLVAYSASVYTTWTVTKFSGTSYDKLFQIIPELPTPAAIVVYSGSDYSDTDWRRVARFAVIVIAEDYGDNAAGEQAVRALQFSALELDEKIYNQALFRASGDNAIDLGHPGIAAYQIDFECRDH